MKLLIILKSTYLLIHISYIIQPSLDSPLRSCQAHALFDKIHVDLIAECHAILELMLIVALSAFTFDVLLNSIDLRLVLNELLFNIIEAVVDFTLQNLILLGVMLHVVVSDLLGQPIFIYLKELFDGTHSDLFIFELPLQVFSLCELVLHLILHSLYFLLSLLHFFMDSSL